MDLIAGGILINSMNDDIAYKYEQYETTHAMWEALKEKFGENTVSKLRQLAIKFDIYKKIP